MNSYANEAVFRMARSVADKFSEREDVSFLFAFLNGNFGGISPFYEVN